MTLQLVQLQRTLQQLQQQSPIPNDSWIESEIGSTDVTFTATSATAEATTETTSADLASFISVFLQHPQYLVFEWKNFG